MPLPIAGDALPALHCQRGYAVSSLIVRMSTFGVTPGTFKPAHAFCECWRDPERDPSHEHYSSSPSKTLRTAIGGSVRFAGNPIRTKQRTGKVSRVSKERLARQREPAGCAASWICEPMRNLRRLAVQFPHTIPAYLTFTQIGSSCLGGQRPLFCALRTSTRTSRHPPSQARRGTGGNLARLIGT
jgi:hypothetical protein